MTEYTFEKLFFIGVFYILYTDDVKQNLHIVLFLFCDKILSIININNFVKYYYSSSSQFLLLLKRNINPDEE